VSISSTWNGTPADIEQATFAYLRRTDRRLDRLILDIQELIERTAQADAKWTDRTGDARAGLTCTALSTAAAQDIVRIVLFHSVSYGVFLELAHGGTYAIIMPTLEKLAPTIRGMLQRVLEP
jgi:hypothetical protein